MRGIPIPEEKRKSLLAAYRDGDRETIKRLVKEYGVSPSYPSELARRKGIMVRPSSSEVRRSESKMWERAIANGALVR